MAQLLHRPQVRIGATATAAEQGNIIMHLIRTAIVALAPFAALAPMAANAAVVTFEDKTPFYCSFENQSSGGLNFAHSFAACFYGPADNADYPTPNTSVVMGIGFSDITVTAGAGAVFSLSQLDLSFGPFSHNDLNSDVTTVTGFLHGGGTITTDLTIGYGFTTYTLNWTGLDSVVFGQLQNSSEYIGFDNINYSVAAVPEAATWAMLIAGFGLTGAAMRRRRVTEVEA